MLAAAPSRLWTSTALPDVLGIDAVAQSALADGDARLLHQHGGGQPIGNILNVDVAGPIGELVRELHRILPGDGTVLPVSIFKRR